MRVSLQMEQFIFAVGNTTVEALADRFGLSPDACRAELGQAAPFGIAFADDGRVWACDF
ncbi:MAG: hypothetical protein ACRC1K_21855 [Planctomycetia bacterium]